MPFGMQLCYWSISLWLGVGRREFSVLRCVCSEIDFEFAVLLVVFWCNKHFPSWASKLGEFEELYKTGKQSRFCTTFGNPPYAASVCLRQRNKYFFTYSHQNKLIDQWKRAYNRKYFIITTLFEKWAIYFWTPASHSWAHWFMRWILPPGKEYQYAKMSWLICCDTLLV